MCRKVKCVNLHEINVIEGSINIVRLPFLFVSIRFLFPLFFHYPPFSSRPHWQTLVLFTQDRPFRS